VGIGVLHYANIFEARDGSVWGGSHRMSSDIVCEIKERPIIKHRVQEREGNVSAFEMNK
jgi:hypothetical protein